MPKLSKTPGAWVLQDRRADGTLVWIGRWKDPASGRRRELNLTAAGLTTAPARTRWKEAKAEELAAFRRARALGRAGPAVAQELAAALAAYLAECDARLRARTRGVYREALRSFQGWCVARGRRIVQEVTPADLHAYRAAAVSQAAAPRTASTHLARVRSALEWLRRGELLPHVSRDHIADFARALPAPLRPVNCLRPAQIRALLDAATTLEPVGAAFIAVALLTGMRLGELEALRWAYVDLDAAPGGELALPAEATKTHRARTIDLSVSPAARRIIDALPRRGPFVFGGEHAASREVAKRWKRACQLDGDEALRRPAVRWTWQHLRQTCGTYLTCSPGIFGAASAYRSAAQLGHAVAVAERHYLGVLRGIPSDATTIEDAMESVAAFDAISALVPAGHAGHDPRRPRDLRLDRLALQTDAAP